MDFLILAGGAARRLDGADKPMIEVAGSAMLDRVISACLAAPLARPENALAAESASAPCVTSATPVANRQSAPVVMVVGPQRHTRVPVRWVREEPPGGGPVAAIAAGLQSCSADLVGIFAADLPFLDAGTVHRLWITLALEDATAPEHDGAVAVDGDGRDQWLAAVYRRAALASRLAEVGPDGVRGLPLRRLVGDLRLARVETGGPSVLDCDTWEDVAAARRIAERLPPGAHHPIEGG